MTGKIVQMPKMAICLAGLLASPLCAAAPLPLWEIGLGAAAISLPDYRGSDEINTYVLPAPYFIYRGDFLKADRSGVRSMLFDSDRVEVNLSINATLPVNSENNPARRGMADLKPAIELGANASFTLWNSSDKKMKLDFRTPVRTGITAESSPRQIGWLVSPNINLDVKDPAGFTGWNLGLLAAVLVNDRKYNGYYYSVGPSDATPVRPVYTAAGGYSGSQITMALSKRFPRCWVGGFMRYDTLAGAVFDNSPLVKRNSTVSAGIAVTWVFSESSKLVDASE